MPDHRFQVDLRGVIDLLSNHLYSGPQVYVRELLQNSVDAIRARLGVEEDHEGEISLQVVEARDGKPPTLIVEDNGIGLSDDEVHQFLATIGQSSKRESLLRDDFIGQFGVGLLSCFVVCDEIVVITKSVREEAKPVEWHGRTDGTYSLRELEYEMSPGTQVFLRAKPGCHDFFEAEYVRKMAAHFGRLLPYPIQVGVGDARWTINQEPPWRVPYATGDLRREALLAFGQRVFDVEFFDAIPLSSRAGGVEGVAYVLPFPAGLSGKRADRVYLKNMLLSEAADNLLPDWAFFVKCVVNATDLRPTASRESFYEDENLEEARASLGRCLRSYLVRLSHDDPRRLQALISTHFLAMKALAVEDDEFYELFIDLLPFETSLGSMTLGEYCHKQPVVRYVSSWEHFRQVSGVAAAQNVCIINAGYTYDGDLVEKLPRVMPERRIEKVDVSELSQTFEDLTLEEREEVFEFIKLADLVLQPYKCSVEMKKFAPDQLPTLYTTNEAATFLRSIDQSKEVADELWTSVLDRIAEDPSAGAYAQLCLNYRNGLIRKMSQLTDKTLIRRSIEMLYVQALLMGHYPLKAQEMNLLNEGLLGLIEYGVDAQGGPE